MCKIWFLVFITIFQVNCQFLSLLQEFDMKNPVIVATMNDLKDKTKYLQVIGRDYKDSPDTIPWFPRNIKVSFHIILVQHIFFSFLTSKIESRTEYENK